jgi:hypothetical protein
VIALTVIAAFVFGGLNGALITDHAWKAKTQEVHSP